MHSQPDGNHILPHVAGGTRKTALDIFGPTVEFLSPPQDAHQDFCVMRGVIPPAVSVPLHSHDDTETFFVLSGYWLGSPEENAAAGIHLTTLSGQ
jgi:quercetin dioxygenase-like cupin family protein